MCVFMKGHYKIFVRDYVCFVFYIFTFRIGDRRKGYMKCKMLRSHKRK